MSYGRQDETNAVGEAEAWVDAGNGSQRLKKIRAAGLMAQSLTVYLEERLEAELPGLFGAGWRFDPRETEEILNPEESDVDALAKWRWKCDVDLVPPSLRFLRRGHYKGPVLVTEFRGRQLMLKLRGDR